MHHLEREIEERFCKLVARKGGDVLKSERVVAGFPDRQVFFKDGRSTFYVELKKFGQKPRKLQTYWHNWLKERGQTVHVLDSMEAVVEFCDAL